MWLLRRSHIHISNQDQISCGPLHTVASGAYRQLNLCYFFSSYSLGFCSLIFLLSPNPNPSFFPACLFHAPVPLRYWCWNSLLAETYRWAEIFNETGGLTSRVDGLWRFRSDRCPDFLLLLLSIAPISTHLSRPPICEWNRVVAPSLSMLQLIWGDADLKVHSLSLCVFVRKEKRLD